MGLFGENAIFSIFICDVTTELMNINKIASKFPNAIPYNGKFSRRPIFAQIRGRSRSAKIKIREIFSKFVQSKSNNPQAFKDAVLQ